MSDARRECFSLDAQRRTDVQTESRLRGSSSAQLVPPRTSSRSIGWHPIGRSRPAEEVISLCADAIVAELVGEHHTQPPSERYPSTARKPGGLGSTAAPAASAGGSGTSASMPCAGGKQWSREAEPTVRKRPAVMITIVKPGEKLLFGIDAAITSQPSCSPRRSRSPYFLRSSARASEWSVSPVRTMRSRSAGNGASSRWRIPAPGTGFSRKSSRTRFGAEW